MKKHLLLLVLGATLTGCATAPANRSWTRSEVYFGLSKPDGTRVELAQWEMFLNEVVTPRFPSGLSVVNASGQWRNSTGHIDHESSKVLVLVHPRSPDAEAKIDEIRKLYCQRFNQEAVMKVTTPARVAF
jgi:hypothetical protein